MTVRFISMPGGDIIRADMIGSVRYRPAIPKYEAKDAICIEGTDIAPNTRARNLLGMYELDSPEACKAEIARIGEELVDWAVSQDKKE